MFSTVHSQILNVYLVPNATIDDTQICLVAGRDVKIVCANKAYPVAVVMFYKERLLVDLSTNR